MDDIADLRHYERVRDDYRARVMARKRLRRVALGPIMTVVFENVDTVRFQVQEMVRAERILSDAGVQAELDVYNRLLPVPGELSATLFIELTSEEELRRWLPALVGVERMVQLELEPPGGGPARAEAGAGVPPAVSVPESAHAAALTREAVTPAVHYLRVPCTPEQVEALVAGPAALAVVHPSYAHRTALSDATRQELVGDLRGTATPLPLG